MKATLLMFQRGSIDRIRCSLSKANPASVSNKMAIHSIIFYSSCLAKLVKIRR